MRRIVSKLRWRSVAVILVVTTLATALCWRQLWIRVPGATIEISAHVVRDSHVYRSFDARYLIVLSADTGDQYIVDSGGVLALSAPSVCNVDDAEGQPFRIDSASAFALADPIPCESMPGVEVIKPPDLKVTLTQIAFTSTDGRRVKVRL